MLLNRYVDLTEAIDEGNASLLDNSDFADATNVPLVDEANLPPKQVSYVLYYFDKNIPGIRLSCVLGLKLSRSLLPRCRSLVRL